MIDHTFIFPPEEDLPISFITWARTIREGVSIKLSFLPTHTTVTVQGEKLQEFNTAVFVLGQWCYQIINNLPEGILIRKESQFNEEAVEAILSGKDIQPISDKEIFNPGNKENLTYHETMGPAMRIKDPEEAKQYLDAYIEYLYVNANKNHSTIVFSKAEAEKLAKHNLNYYSGYYDEETGKRVQELFQCSPKYTNA